MIDMTPETIDNKLVIDALYYDPHYQTAYVVRIGNEHFLMHGTWAPGKLLRPYKIKPRDEWEITENHTFFFCNLIPRGGYHQVNAGRPATAEEFADIISTYGLTEDDISDEFEDVRGGLYGPDAEIRFTSKQIRVPDAIGVEQKLRDRGIEAANTSPGRVNIRVDGCISLAEYADMHGVTPDTVRQKVLRGGFKTARKIGRNWVIDKNEPYTDNRKCIPLPDIKL
jgi:hypothetical protein